MVQIYFFSVVFLVFCGLFLSYEYFGNLLKYYFIFNKDIFTNKRLAIIVGIFSIFLGFLLILTTNNVPIIGDIIPAIFGIVGGCVLVFRSWEKYSYKGKNKTITLLISFLNANSAIFGLLTVIVGLIHVFFPEVILL